MKEKFGPAFSGLRTGLADAGIRIQMILAALAVIAGFVLKLTLHEWAMVAICIALVISTEIINTCIEKVCDLYSQETDERIRVIKDLAAAAVLTAALGALIAALLILKAHLT